MSKNGTLDVVNRLVEDTKHNILGGRKVQSYDNWGKFDQGHAKARLED